jgi:iron-hydrogenase subunit gamma
MSANAIQEVLEAYPDAKRDALIPILQNMQRKEGFISREAVVAIGHHLDLPASKIYGVATFYNQFRFQPYGKYLIQICRGTACHVKGSLAVLDTLRHILKVEPGQTTRDGKYSLEVVACLGACGLAPLVSVNGEFHGGVTPDLITDIINNLNEEAEEA